VRFNPRLLAVLMKSRKRKLIAMFSGGSTSDRFRLNLNIQNLSSPTPK
jgi:hypothetical protein